MAEIKSTLDLVLERTKNLTLTPEEKASFHLKDLEGRMRGWVQKFLDGGLTLDALKAEMGKIEPKDRKEALAFFKNLVVESIDPEGENDKAFQLLEDVLESKKAPYLQALQDFREKMDREKSGFLEKLKKRLAERQISGNALSPNLSRDREWNAFYEKARVEFRKRLSLIQDN